MARASHPILRTLGATAAGLSLAVLARAAVRRARRLDLSGRVVVVTGGSRGLGLLIAEEAGRRGARVAICGRDPAALHAAERRLSEQGIEVLARPCDLGDRGQAEVFIERASLEWGRIDVLVNNAGVIHVEPVQSTSLESVEEAMRSNFWSAANATFAALPHLTERAGEARLVNITSIGGRVAVPHLLGYVASKFAFVGFSEGLSAELSRSGVRVTTVVPWLMRTGSYYNAEFAGRPDREMAWFSVGAALPLVSVNARRAARRIVRAIEDGERLVHVGLASAILARAAGLLPGITTRVMSVLDRVLPEPDPHPEGARRGREILSPLRGSPLLRFGDRAARENNEAPNGAAGS
jgi:short-subunit dehydrogenase